MGDPEAGSVVARAIATLRQVGEIPHGDGSDLPPLKKADEKHFTHSLIAIYKKAGVNPVPSVADVSTMYPLPSPPTWSTQRTSMSRSVSRWRVPRVPCVLP